MADESVFDEGIDLFDKLKVEMEKNILKHATLDVQARSQPYRKYRLVQSSFPPLHKKKKCTQFNLNCH